MSIRKIMVTGGNGFIGTNFIMQAIGIHGYDVFNVDKMTYASRTTVDEVYEKNWHYQKLEKDICDIVDRDVPEDIDAIVNIAAESHVDNSINDPSVFLQSNIEGTFNLLELCKFRKKKTGRNIRFVQVSTDEVYGSLKPNDPAFTEQHQIQPNSPYSASKASADAFVRAYHETYGLNTVITRCSNNYGPYQHNEKFIPKIIENALDDKPIPVYGDGRQVRDWIFVTDHCEAVITAMRYGKAGQVYNVGGDCEMENIDIVKTILDRVKKGDELIEYVTDRLGHDRRYAMDHRKITYELGWNPMTQFENGITAAIKSIIIEKEKENE
jgi:dTDP-glucose 4,6-dehydratase